MEATGAGPAMGRQGDRARVVRGGGGGNWQGQGDGLRSNNQKGVPVKGDWGNRGTRDEKPIIRLSRPVSNQRPHDGSDNSRALNIMMGAGDLGFLIFTSLTSDALCFISVVSGCGRFNLDRRFSSTQPQLNELIARTSGNEDRYRTDDDIGQNG